MTSDSRTADALRRWEAAAEPYAKTPEGLTGELQRLEEIVLHSKSELSLDSVSGYTLVYACFFGDGEIIGFTKTAEAACEWSARVAGNNKSVRIIKIYEIKNPRNNQKP